MNFTKRMLAAAGLAVTSLFGGTTAANAAPIVTSWTAATVAEASVVDPFPLVALAPDFGLPFALDLQSSWIDPSIKTAAARMVAKSDPLGSNPDVTEQARSRAEATIDDSNFNASTVKAQSVISSGNTLFPDDCGCLFAAAVGTLGATLQNPDPLVSVDLQLNITGKLMFRQGATPAGGSEETSCDGDPLDPETICVTQFFSDMTASMSLLLVLAENVIPEDIVDPSYLPVAPLFNGSLLLVVQPDGAGGYEPELVTEGDFMGHTFALTADESGGSCTLDSCFVDVSLSLNFADVQSLGFDDLFEVGLILLTTADVLSAVDRGVESNFFNTASVNVTFVPQQVPVPGSLLLLSLGLLGMGAARRRRTLH